MTVDSISNLLTVLRNGIAIKKSLVSLPYTKTNYQIVKILENQGFIHCATFTNQKSLNMNLFPSKQSSQTSTGLPHQEQWENSQNPPVNSLQTKQWGESQDFSQPKNKQNNVSLSKYIVIALKYVGREKKPIIHSLKRISKPSLRWYLPNPVPQSLGGLGIFIVSTSLGMMTDKEARTKKVGGEIIAEIW